MSQTFTDVQSPQSVGENYLENKANQLFLGADDSVLSSWSQGPKTTDLRPSTALHLLL